MTINKTTEGDTVVLSLTGWMDTQNASVLEQALSELEPDTRHLVLDLGGLEYTSSAGVRQLVAAHKRMSGEMTLRNVRKDVLDVLAMTGLTKKLHIEE